MYSAHCTSTVIAQTGEARPNFLHVLRNGWMCENFPNFSSFFECLSFYPLFHVHVHAGGPRRRLRLLVLIRLIVLLHTSNGSLPFLLFLQEKIQFSKGIISKFKSQNSSLTEEEQTDEIHVVSKELLS